MDRVSSENPSVETVTGTVRRYGGTSRPQVELPADAADDFPADEVVRVTLAGTSYRTRIERSGDSPVLRGAYETPSQAREPGSAEDFLREWLADAELDVGRSVLVDVIEPGYAYGVRAPGETAYYDATEKPKDSLADIARDLDG